MADINAGFTFSGSAPNNVVNASNLNALVGGAVVQPALITAKTLKTAPVGADSTLILDSVTGTLMKAVVSTLPAQAAVSRRNFTRLTLNTSSTTRVAMAWAEIVLRSSSGLAIYFGAGNTYADLTTASPPSVNGRDFTGSVPAFTWLYFFVVSDGTTTYGLISQCLTTLGVPDNLPSGVTYYGLVGAAITTSGGLGITQFYQADGEVMVQPPTAAGTTFGGVSASVSLNPWTGATSAEFTNIHADTLSTFQAVNCIPPWITAKVRGVYGATANVTQNAVVASYATGTIASPTLLYGAQFFPLLSSQSAVATYAFNAAVNFEVAIAVSQQISWANHDATNAQYSMRVTGYTLNL